MGTNLRRFSNDALFASAMITLAIGLAAVVGLSLAARASLPLGGLYPLKATALFAIVMLVAVSGLHGHHPFARFGAANHITTARAGLVALVGALIGEPEVPVTAAWAVGAGCLVTALDGVDGSLARQRGMASRFGARFDLEVDALLILVLAVLAWRYDKAGAWVVLSGLLRYVFLAAGWIWTWLRRPLPASRRRQTICVVQIIALLLVMLPIVRPPFSGVLAAAALGALGFSFVIDILWLRRQRSPAKAGHYDWKTGVSLAAALALLNASLTFGNVWPTPAIRWQGQLSIELAACILALLAARRWFGPPSPAALGCLSAIWVVLIIGRYGDVTAPALYGREINLYWDLRYVPDVVAMLARVASGRLVALIAASAVLMLYVIFAVVRWAMRRLASATSDARERRVLSALTAALAILFAVERLGGGMPIAPGFSNPVLVTYTRQVPLAFAAIGGTTSLAPSPPMNSTLALVRGADVFLMFIESYGAVSYEEPEIDRRLAPSRSDLDAAITSTGRDVVSAYVESPTFGGASWLAHLSLLSGVEVRDPDTNARLMTETRETMVTTFARHGYRTVAVMPGLWQRWPEGAFYGFDAIYRGDQLDYRGPPFGWWSIPDQFAIAKLDQLEVSRPSRQPLFVFFPTISTHTPFTPTPPYQSDWRRMLTATPYEAADLERAWDETPDWMNLGPGYVDALSYAYRALGGYLRMRADRDFVLIVIGDHQPPAAVSGEGARWDVPVHVISRRADLIARLRAGGFQPGLRPSGPALVRMHALLPILLGAFGDPQ